MHNYNYPKVSFDDTVVYMNAKLSDSGEDLLEKISKPKSRCYSFDMPPFEDTKVNQCVDYGHLLLVY